MKGINTVGQAAGNVANIAKGNGTGSDCGTKDFFKRMIKF